MRYIQPQITGTFAALSTIHGSKHDVSIEISQELTGTPAYEADE
jgi:hypothetical protein